MIAAIQKLAAKNSYGRLRIDFESNGGKPFFDVVLSPQEGYKPNPLDPLEYAFDEAALFGMITKFSTSYPAFDLSSYDHVVVFVPGYKSKIEMGVITYAAPSRTVQYITFQYT